MDFFDNHRKLFRSAFALFVGLTLIVAILPAINNQRDNAPLPGSSPLTKDEHAGKKSFIANGCVACHTQQVRNVDMDNVWGDRPGIPADYAHIRSEEHTSELQSRPHLVCRLLLEKKKNKKKKYTHDTISITNKGKSISCSHE